MLRAEVEGAKSAICGGGGAGGQGEASLGAGKGTGGLGTGVYLLALQNWGDDLVDKVRGCVWIPRTHLKTRLGQCLYPQS